ncbi:GAF sensor signal transduction histidine kinase [Alteromonadaceae bacterium Bs31]|nr:GAF sensor signal transduction histidine kinase [Alteromonadaceae bacterium Bs31]
MQSAPDHPNEQDRLAALLGYEILDSQDEQAFDELTELAGAICGTPISLISLVDDHRQWFKSRIGLSATETPKSIAFCSHAILQSEVFEIPNALEDVRFADNPLVTGDPDIRFYAGAPLVAPNGSPIGTLCVIDTEPKKLTPDQNRALQILSKQVISQLDLRLHTRRLEKNARCQQNMLATISHDLRSPFNAILGLAKRLSLKAEDLSQERISEAAHSILSASLKVYQLLDEMLQWSSNRLGATSVSLETTYLLPLITSSSELLHEATQLKKIDFNCYVDKNIAVNVDVTLTKAVIRNLLNNAIKFTPPEEKISISAVAQEETVVLRVLNNGESIPEEKQKLLFNDPVSSDSGTAGESGSGLGLRLCKEFTEMQGGQIYLESSTKEGTCFVLELPKA